MIADWPQHMTDGPWGGVRVDGRCEVDDRACPFPALLIGRWQTTPARVIEPNPTAAQELRR